MINSISKKICNLIRIASFSILIISTFLPITANAKFSLDRVNLSLTNQKPIKTIKVTAGGKSKSVFIQAKIYKWMQKDGKDIYESTKDLIVSPPFMKLATGSTQILRVGMRKPLQNITEGTYRLFLKEVTPLTEKKGIQFRLNLVLPIFIKSSSPTLKGIFNIKSLGNNKYELLVQNTGNTHLGIIRFIITDRNNKSETIPSPALYILAGQKNMFEFTMKKIKGNNVTIKAQTSTQTLNQKIIISN